MFFVTTHSAQPVHRYWALAAVGYEFDNSWAVEDDMFVGLVLDEVNQPEMTAVRIERWLPIVSR